jgi:subtilase family serine protease
MNVGRRVLALGAAGALGLSGALVSSASSGAQEVSSNVTVRIAADAPPAVPRGSAELGALAPSRMLRLDVTLKIRRPRALTAFIADVSNKQSPLFDHFLAPGQFGPRFGLSLSAAAAVRAALQRAGLSPGPLSSDRLSIPVTASAAAVEHAFGTELVRYRLPGGRVAFTNAGVPKISAAVAPYVSGILGLNNLYLAHNMLAWPVPNAAGQHHALPSRALRPDASGPRACAAARNAASSFNGFTAGELASYYLMTPMYGLGDLGRGVRVALFELEPNSLSDISGYERCYGIHTAITYKKIDGGAGSGAGSGEAALDIEDVIGLAPAVALDVYQGPNGGDADIFDTYHAIVKADKDQVISTSWGDCELNTDSLLFNDEQSVFSEAAAQGQTVFAAAGDTGSTGCLRDGTNRSALSAGDPASQPNVIGVGGTTATRTTEKVWNDSSIDNGAGGGGLSGHWCMPSYQYKPAIPGLISSISKTNSACSTSNPGSFVRQEPDVAADADPQTGYVIDYRGGWGTIGGTSAAAPLWAAVAALIDASPFCKDYGSGDAGVRPAGLYSVANVDHAYIYASLPEALFDITKGNNDYTPSGYSGGLFPATRGYDMATGLGTPLLSGLAQGGKVSMFLPGLAAVMCEAYATRLKTSKVTGVSPRHGHATETITVTGSGFLPIAGADRARVGSVTVNASCKSTTTCTIVLPRHNLGTVDIRISAEDFGYTATSSADQFTYVAAPTITSLSPNHGAPRGGNRVTIHGTNFIGVMSVHFGRRRATHVTVVSPTKIIVTVPAGSGRVKVTVTAAGGTSLAGHYQY